MSDNYSSNFLSNSHSSSSESNSINRRPNMAAVNGDTFGSCYNQRNDFYGRNSMRFSTGNQNETFNQQPQWTWQKISEESSTAMRSNSSDARSSQAFISSQTRATVGGQTQQRQDCATVNQFRHPNYQQRQLFPPVSPAILTRQNNHRFMNISCSKSEWLPTDLLHVQPLKHTLSIEDMFRHEVALAGGFELHGNDMETLFTLAGL